jgi:NAD(P)-dependent dehydrogenase (short-subunit alcohol dehydrogenase family)
MEQMHIGAMTGKTVLVTGGTAGIGRATALGLARLGAHLAIIGSGRGRGSRDPLCRPRVGGRVHCRPVLACGGPAIR